MVRCCFSFLLLPLLISYDHNARVPLIIMGNGIRSRVYSTEASPANIAPTLSRLLSIHFIAGRDCHVLTEALKVP